MPWTLELLNILIDPNLLYLLFLAGIIGIGCEVFHPGVILPGTLGAVSLILALFGFSIVSINLAGVVLMMFGVVLLGLEAWVSAHGLMGISGVIAIAAGGLMLFRTPGEGVSPLLVIGMSIVGGHPARGRRHQGRRGAASAGRHRRRREGHGRPHGHRPHSAAAARPGVPARRAVGGRGEPTATSPRAARWWSRQSRG